MNPLTFREQLARELFVRYRTESHEHFARPSSDLAVAAFVDADAFFDLLTERRAEERRKPNGRRAPAGSDEGVARSSSAGEPAAGQ